MVEGFRMQLFTGLVETYSMEQMRTLCMTLGLTHERLKQDNLEVIARELIDYMRRDGRLGDLLQQVKLERPRYQLWPELIDLEEPIFFRQPLGKEIRMSDIVNELLEWKQAHHIIQNYWVSLILIQRRVEMLHTNPSDLELFELENSWHSSCYAHEKSLIGFLNSKTIIRDDQELIILKSLLLGDSAFSHYIRKANIGDKWSLRSLYFAHLELIGLLPSILRTIDLHIIKCAEIITKLIDTD